MAHRIVGSLARGPYEGRRNGSAEEADRAWIRMLDGPTGATNALTARNDAYRRCERASVLTYMRAGASNAFWSNAHVLRDASRDAVWYEWLTSGM